MSGGCSDRSCPECNDAETLGARVAELETQLAGVEALESANEEGYERDIRALRAQLAEATLRIERLSLDLGRAQSLTHEEVRLVQRVNELEAAAWGVLNEACHCEGTCGMDNCPAVVLRALLVAPDSSAASPAFSGGARGPAAADGPLYPRPSEARCSECGLPYTHDLRCSQRPNEARPTQMDEDAAEDYLHEHFGNRFSASAIGDLFMLLARVRAEGHAQRPETAETQEVLQLRAALAEALGAWERHDLTAIDHVRRAGLRALLTGGTER